MQTIHTPTPEQLIYRQKNHLQTLIQRYNQKTKTSKQYAQQQRPILADNKNVGFSLPLKEMFYPIVTKHSFGSKIWDIDDNEYLDVTMGFGINLFGHNPPFIKAALHQQLEQGIQLGVQSEYVGEVAQLICEFTGMERVAFSNTGTEAVMTAIRLARTASDRKKIVIFSGSYHGHFDGTLAKSQLVDGNLQTVPISLGTPSNFVEDVIILEYGNSRSLEIIKDRERELASVLVEPVQSRQLDLQPQKFLQELRQITQESGIVLIFDEMVTGFRIHPGGAQAWFGIKADIATYGKIVGGGMPIGIVAGKASLMDAIDGGMWNYGDDSIPQAKTTFFAGTFCKHPLAIASALAVLQHLKNQGSILQQNLNQLTSNFVEKLNSYFTAEALPIQMVHFGSIFGTASAGNTSSEDAAIGAMDLLYYHLLDRGILLRGGGGFLSTAHTEEDIDYIISAVKNSVEELRSGGFLPT